MHLLTCITKEKIQVGGLISFWSRGYKNRGICVNTERLIYIASLGISVYRPFSFTSLTDPCHDHDRLAVAST